MGCRPSPWHILYTIFICLSTLFYFSVLSSLFLTLRPTRGTISVENRNAFEGTKSLILDKHDKTAHFEQIKTIRSRFGTVVRAYTETVDRGPDDTVEELIREMGVHDAAETVAEIVNATCSWDGHLTNKVRSWASSFPTAECSNELVHCGLYKPKEIHTPHLEQISESMIRVLEKKGVTQL